MVVIHHLRGISIISDVGMSVHVDANRYGLGTGDSGLGDRECRHPDPDPERSGKTLGLAMTHRTGGSPDGG